MTGLLTQTTKKTAFESEGFFRSAAMEKPSPPPLDIALLARPLSFRLISLTFAVMAIIAVTYLSNVDYASTHSARGTTVPAHDDTIQFAAVVLPTTAVCLNNGGRAMVQFDAYASDNFSAIGATIISIGPIQEELPGSPGIRIVLQLDQGFLDSVGTRIPLQAGLSGDVKLIMETKSLLAWINHYFRFREES